MSAIENFILSFMEMSVCVIFLSKFDEKLRMSKFKNLIFIAVVSLSATITDYMNIEFNFIMNILFFILFAYMIFKVDLARFFSKAILTMITLAIVQLIVILAISLVREIEYNFLNGLMVNGLVLATYLIVCKKFEFQKIDDLLENNAKIMSFVLGNILVVITMIVYFWSAGISSVLEQIWTICLSVLFWGSINMFLCYQMLKNKEQENIINLDKEYISVIEDLITEVKGKQHDFKNHLCALSCLAENVKDESVKNEIKEYVFSINDEGEKTENLLAINNNILTALIYSKKKVAQDKVIEFEFQMKYGIPKFPLKNHEMIEIVGNLLDNAFEAVLENEDLSSRRVSFEIGRLEDVDYMRVENYGEAIKPEIINKIFMKGYSTKGKNRGYGLYNIKKIVALNKGAIEISYRAGYNIVAINFKNTIS